MSDLKKAFGFSSVNQREKRASEQAAVVNEEDPNFLGSNIELNDFRIYQEFNKIENKKLQKSVAEIINVRCTDKSGLDRFENRGERDDGLATNELKITQKSRRSSDASGPKNRRGGGGNAVVPELKLGNKKSSRSNGSKTNLFPPVKGAVAKPK